MGKERPGKTREKLAAHVFQEDPDKRSRHVNADAEPMIEKGSKPREAARVERKI
jgi:hypothetical protein